MKCAACGQPMIVLEIEEVEIDHCQHCEGTWLDAGELELLLEGATNRDTLLERLKNRSAGRERKLRCPICRRRLEKVTYGTEATVVLDVCPGGDGIWFDRGELYDVIRRGDFPTDNRVYEFVTEIFGRSG